MCRELRTFERGEPARIRSELGVEPIGAHLDGGQARSFGDQERATADGIVASSMVVLHRASTHALSVVDAQILRRSALERRPTANAVGRRAQGIGAAIRIRDATGSDAMTWMNAVAGANAGCAAITIGDAACFADGHLVAVAAAEAVRQRGALGVRGARARRSPAAITRTATTAVVGACDRRGPMLTPVATVREFGAGVVDWVRTFARIDRAATARAATATGSACACTAGSATARTAASAV